MRTLTEVGLQRQGRARRIQVASDSLTARSLSAEDRAHDALAWRVERGDGG